MKRLLNRLCFTPLQISTKQLVPPGWRIRFAARVPLFAAIVVAHFAFFANSLKADSFSTTGNMGTWRYFNTVTLLPNGKVLVAGGADTLSSAELYNSDGTWSATGSLQAGRYYHTATLLPDGRVLVTGGLAYDSELEENDWLSSAELYQTGGTWSTTGAMSAKRVGHTATLLANGKVLVVGGANGSYLSSVDLFTPSSSGGTWSTATALSVARTEHMAVRLPNGKVLVAGGLGSGGYLSSAVLYNEDGSWSSTGALGAPRSSGVATLLPNGKVLVARGFNSNGALTSAEVYDPANGSWTATGSMSTWGYTRNATLLPDGKVLIAGGSYVNEEDKTVPSDIAEVFDPVGNGGIGSWSTAASLNTARDDHTAVLLPSGKALIIGGLAEDAVPLSTAELYDWFTSANSWTTTTSAMSAARAFHTVTLLPMNGKVLVTGGRTSGGSYLSSAELFDPAGSSGAGSWSTAYTMSVEREKHTATLLGNGKVLIVGGFNGGDPTEVDLYAPDANSWTTAASLTTGRQLHTGTLLPNGKVLIAGGANGGYLSTAILYDPSANTWTATGNNMANDHAEHTATLLPNGKVLVAGGNTSVADIYDPVANSWSTAQGMSYERTGHVAVLLPTGKVLVAGGVGTASTTAELYDPALNSWSSTATLTGRRDFYATLLPATGDVLVAGGYVSSFPNNIYHSSAQRYNISSGTWNSAASMSTGRRGCGGSLIPINGKVLVVGGLSGSSSYLSSVTLYSP